MIDFSKVSSVTIPEGSVIKISDSEGVVYWQKDNVNIPYEGVDLGLNSGTIWANCNIGALEPQDIGKYFAWGETKGYSSVTNDKKFNWNDYKFSQDGSYRIFTKYNTTDGLMTLDASDDAASIWMGKEWKIPTIEQLEELNSLDTSLVKMNGIYGRMFNGKNGNTLFFPMNGNLKNGVGEGIGAFGRYWTKSRHEQVAYSWSLAFNSSLVKTLYNMRSLGQCIRGVKKK